VTAGRSSIAGRFVGAIATAVLLTTVSLACGSGSSTTPSATSSPASISITGAPPAIGASSQFTATANFLNGTTQNVTSAANWQSTTAAVATVSSTGVVAGVGAGDSDIRATYQSVTGTMHVTIGAAAFTLLGVVSETSSHAPVDGAAVSVLDGINAGRSTTTDGNGYYSFGGLRAGSFSLEARKAGYATASNPIGLTGDLRFDFSMTSTAPPPSPAPQCNAALWSHIYDPSRLQVYDGCRTVTGTITDQHTNDDGDVDVRLAVDPPYTSLLNAGNMSNLSGHLQTEAICQTKIIDPSAASACRGYTGTIAIPPNGTHVQVTGPYVYDKIHGWMEIHPISVLSVIR